jgi:hypothetical protein
MMLQRLVSPRAFGICRVWLDGVENATFEGGVCAVGEVRHSTRRSFEKNVIERGVTIVVVNQYECKYVVIVVFEDSERAGAALKYKTVFGDKDIGYRRVSIV